MKPLNQIISKLLYDNECVIVPGFGAFVTEKAGASIHPGSNEFSPPFKKLRFNSQLQNNDGLLVGFIAKEYGLNYDEVISQVKVNVLSWKDKLNNNGTVVIDEVGKLFHDMENNLQFLPELNKNFETHSYGLQSFRSLPIAKNKVTQKPLSQSKPKKKRGIYAFALIMAISLLLLNLGMVAFDKTPDSLQMSSIVPLFSVTNKSIDENKVEAEHNMIALNKANMVEVSARPLKNNNKITVVDLVENKDELYDNSVQFHGEYVVFVGCFENRGNALKMKKRLQKTNSKICVKQRGNLFCIGFPAGKQIAESSLALSQAYAQYGDAWMKQL